MIAVTSTLRQVVHAWPSRLLGRPAAGAISFSPKSPGHLGLHHKKKNAARALPPCIWQAKIECRTDGLHATGYDRDGLTSIIAKTESQQNFQRCMKPLSHKFCVAPMMDWTDRHCRMFHRQLTRHALLYTEMVTADAILRGNRERLIGFSNEEHPIALQLGGSDPAKLASAAAIGAEYGYDEINLNIGCPSDRVQEGRFGACLMAEPQLVAACIAAMQQRVAIPVTVKCRIGIDDQDEEADFQRFVDTIAATGCKTFIVHARKAWLKGLSPKENREVPPLDYGRVYRLKAARPDLEIIINGGIETLDECDAHLAHVDGVMLGRAAYQDPALLGEIDQRYFGITAPLRTRGDALRALVPYAERHIMAGGRLSNISRHVLGLYHGQPRGRAFRRFLSETATLSGATADVLRDAVELVEFGQHSAQRDTAA
jgi:tRNA-dihydrouridine synthase A